MDENEGRAALMREAPRWLGTPYRNVGCMRGAGANCATLQFGIARDAGVLPPGFPEPHWYSPQLHVHSPEERLINNVLRCGGAKIEEKDVKPGDIVAWLTGKSHGHIAMVIDWPRKVIQTTQMGGCQYADPRGGRLSASTMQFFSLWPPKESAVSSGEVNAKDESERT